MGSGKLVLLNGSVSSRNWTLHTNVAMVHPCKSGLDQENGGCAAAAPRAGNRSSAAAAAKKKKNPVNVGPSPFVSHSGERSRDSQRATSEVKDPGYLRSERRGNEPGGHVRGHCGRLMR